MIKLDDIKDRSALSLLNDYKGKNPYIKKLRKEYKQKGKLILTENQSKYIIDNFKTDPIKINRVLEITEYLGEELKKQNDLSFTPKKILIQFILGETEKTFHIYGKLKKNQKESKMYWIPKTQLIDDPYFAPIDVEVDFEKYTKLDKLNRTLFDHQKTGVKFLLTRNGAILADDMGLGKTMQSIIAALESGAEKILIVCPASVKINWEREINNFCMETSIIIGKKWTPNKFTIINYDILKNFHTLDKKKKKKNDPEDYIVEFNEELINHKFDLCIIDEAHYLKNHKSIRGKIMVDLCVNHGIEKVWLLTGTPIANKPMDYYNLLKLIKAPIADNWVFFAKRYCDAKKFFKTLKNGRKKQIWLTDGASNLDELSKKTRNNLLRRLKEDVLDLPPKIITPLLHELTNRQWLKYDSLWEEYLELRKEKGKKGSIQRDLVELGLLRKYIAMEAIPYTIEMVDNILDQNKGHKIVIFTTFTDELMELHNYYNKNSVIHYGEMSDTQKQNSIDEFMDNDNINVFIGNIVSAGTGINLTRGNFIIFNSFSWVPGLNQQAEDRCNRIGQKYNVNVYYQLFSQTITTRMWLKLNDKINITNQILKDNKVKSKAEEEVLNKIIIDSKNEENG